VGVPVPEIQNLLFSKLIIIFKFFKGQINDIIPNYIPEDHIILNISTDMYHPITFNRFRIVYYKHADLTITQVNKLYIEEGHPLWNYIDF